MSYKHVGMSDDGREYCATIVHNINYWWWGWSVTDVSLYWNDTAEEFEDKTIEALVEQKFHDFRNKTESVILTYSAQEIYEFLYSKLNDFYFYKKPFNVTGLNNVGQYFTIEVRSDWDIECNIYNELPDEYIEPTDGWVVETYKCYDNTFPTNYELWDQAKYIADNCWFDITDEVYLLDELQLDSIIKQDKVVPEPQLPTE